MTKSERMGRKRERPDSSFSSDISQVGTGDEFLDKLLSNDSGLEDGAVPDLKVIDTDINMSSGEVNASTLLDFFNQLSSKSSASLEMIKEEPLSEEDLRALQKDRQKKDNHNMIERRRRYNINDRIKELGTLLPKEDDQYFDIVRDVRQNKGSILKASVEYIRKLKVDQERKDYLEEKCKLQEYQNKKLLLKLQEYEGHMKNYGISVSGGWKVGGQSDKQQPFAKTLHYQPTKHIDIKEEDTSLDLTDSCNLVHNDLDDLMEDDNHPVSSCDPMLSSPAPSSTLSSSSPTSIYSNDDALSSESIDLLV